MCKSHSSCIHCCLFQRGYVKGNSIPTFLICSSACSLIKRLMLFDTPEDYFIPVRWRVKGRETGPGVRWLSFVPSSTFDSIHALGQVTEPLHAVVSGDEICQLHHVDLNLSGLWDKNRREPGVHVGSDWWEENDHGNSKVSLSCKVCNRVRIHQCPWAFVQWPVGSILVLEFFQRKEGTAISPHLCTSPALILTTHCCYLLDHLPPGLGAAWGRGSCLPHATLYPQYQAHAWQTEVMPVIFAEWMNTATENIPLLLHWGGLFLAKAWWDLINPISPQLHLDVIMKGLRPSAMTHMYSLVRRFKNVQTAGSVSREVPAAWPFKCSVHTTWKVLLRVTGQYSKDRILVSIRQAEFSETMDEHRTSSKSCLWCHSERWVVKVWLESYSQLCGREYIPAVLAKAHDLNTSKLQQ